MSDLRAPRFPYVAALLCAACVGAAAWTWMRYSYCWRTSPDNLLQSIEREEGQTWAGKYVSLGEEIRTGNALYWSPDESVAGFQLAGHWPTVRLMTPVPPEFWKPDGHQHNILIHSAKGRVDWFYKDNGEPQHFVLVVDARASRFHGASIFGLVVGAMGVFVFTIALRHWLGERRKLREEA
jgi:hypothetical protein